MLEGQRQVAVEKLEAHFQRLSDRVNETQVLEGERQLGVVELEGNFKQLSERVNETKALVGLFDDQIVNTKRAFSAEVKGTSLAVAVFGVALQKSGRDFCELASFVDAWLALTIWNSGGKSSLRACEVQPPGQGGIKILAAVQRKFQQSLFMKPDVLQFINRMVDIPAACRSWYAQCTLCNRPCSGDGCLAPVVVQRQVPWLGRSSGLRNAWFDYGYIFCIIQGGF